MSINFHASLQPNKKTHPLFQNINKPMYENNTQLNELKDEEQKEIKM